MLHIPWHWTTANTSCTVQSLPSCACNLRPSITAWSAWLTTAWSAWLTTVGWLRLHGTSCRNAVVCILGENGSSSRHCVRSRDRIWFTIIGSRIGKTCSDWMVRLLCRMLKKLCRGALTRWERKAGRYTTSTSAISGLHSWWSRTESFLCPFGQEIFWVWTTMKWSLPNRCGSHVGATSFRSVFIYVYD